MYAHKLSTQSGVKLCLNRNPVDSCKSAQKENSWKYHRSTPAKHTTLVRGRSKLATECMLEGYGSETTVRIFFDNQCLMLITDNVYMFCSQYKCTKTIDLSLCIGLLG